MFFEGILKIVLKDSAGKSHVLSSVSQIPFAKVVRLLSLGRLEMTSKNWFERIIKVKLVLRMPSVIQSL